MTKKNILCYTSGLPAPNNICSESKPLLLIQEVCFLGQSTANLNFFIMFMHMVALTLPFLKRTRLMCQLVSFQVLFLLHTLSKEGSLIWLCTYFSLSGPHTNRFPMQSRQQLVTHQKRSVVTHTQCETCQPSFQMPQI